MGKNLQVVLTPDQASACVVLGCPEARLDPEGFVCGAAEGMMRQRRHGNSARVPRGIDGKSLCPQEIGIQKQVSRK